MRKAGFDCTINRCVQALMKITTHCSEKSSDEQVNGFLVGGLRPGFIEVTNAFPLPDNLSGTRCVY